MSSDPSTQATTPAQIPGTTEGVKPPPRVLANGRLSLGRGATSEAVVVRLGADGLEIDGSADGLRRQWPYAVLKPSTPLSRALDDVLLTSKSEDGATLFVADKVLIRELAGKSKRLTAGAQRWRWARPGFVIMGVACAGIGALYAFDVSPAKSVAFWLPDNARQSLGRNVVQAMTQGHPVCTDASGTAALQKLLAKLETADPRTAKFDVKVYNWNLLNAFTAPGGQIIVTRELIARSTNPDELAGVIAHEMGHALERHPETGLVRAIGLAAAAEIIMGGQGGQIANIGIALTQISYTRDAEREADNHAFRLLKGAKIAPKGIADFFRRVAVMQHEDKRPSATDIFMTHPASNERAKIADDQPAYPSEPAMSAADWQALRAICGPVAAPTPPKPQVTPSPSQPPKTSVTTTPTTPTPPATADTPVDARTEKLNRDVQESTVQILQGVDVAKARIRRADAYIELRNYSAAIRDLDEVIATDASDMVSLRKRGRSYAESRNFLAAARDYDLAIKSNANDSAAHAGLGAALGNMKRFEESLAEHTLWVQLQPQNAVARLWRARAYAQLSLDTEAIADYDFAIKLTESGANPVFPIDTYEDRGRLHLRNEHWQLAKADFTKIIDKDKQRIGVFIARAEANEKLDLKAEASADYTAALDLATKTGRGISRSFVQGKLAALAAGGTTPPAGRQATPAPPAPQAPPQPASVDPKTQPETENNVSR